MSNAAGKSSEGFSCQRVLEFGIGTAYGLLFVCLFVELGGLANNLVISHE